MRTDDLTNGSADPQPEVDVRQCLDILVLAFTDLEVALWHFLRDLDAGTVRQAYPAVALLVEAREAVMKLDHALRRIHREVTE